MKKRIKKTLSIFLISFLIIIAALFIIRLINPTEIDDISPGIPCPELQQYDPDILYVIPNYENQPLSFYPEWCKYLLSLNKTLALHGINHTYKEFLYKEISQEELEFGISEFEKCFGFSPDTFKPPQLMIDKENKQLIKENNLERRTVFQQITHKVYHCNDSDIISNRIVNIL